MHTSGAQGSAVRAKRLGACCWAFCLPCPTCGLLGGAESTEPRMMLQGQADCRTPGTLQAQFGAPTCSLPPKADPGLRGPLAWAVGQDHPSPSSPHSSCLGVSVDPQDPRLHLSCLPHGQSVPAGQGPVRDAPRVVMTPWAEHEKPALFSWSLLPLSLQALCPGACGTLAREPVALALIHTQQSPARLREVSWGRPHSLDGAVLGEWGRPS